MSEITKDAISWPTVEAYINRRIAACHMDLETAPAARVPVLQGEIQGLRQVLIKAAESNYAPDPGKRAASAY